MSVYKWEKIDRVVLLEDILVILILLLPFFFLSFCCNCQTNLDNEYTLNQLNKWSGGLYRRDREGWKSATKPLSSYFSSFVWSCQAILITNTRWTIFAWMNLGTWVDGIFSVWKLPLSHVFLPFLLFLRCCFFSLCDQVLNNEYMLNPSW